MRESGSARADSGSGEKALPPALDEPVPARAQLRQALLRPTRSQIVVAMLLAGLGFLTVTQARTNEVNDTYATYREQDLISVLKTMSDTAQRAELEISRLERRRADLRDQARSSAAALAQAQEDEDTLNILAGQTPVEGPGIKIVVTEGADAVSVDSLLDTVQALRSSGAEAMEFDDRVRVVAQTAFSPSAAGILVGGAVVERPYVLEVIGDQRTLQGALTFPGGPIDQLEDDGAKVSVTALDNVDVESVRLPERLEYASRDEGQ
jgi:uncharacterized protein YlxW (UPF0749 family)